MDDRIERELLIEASPEEVWEVVTAPGWLAEEVELELFPGGDARFASVEWCKAGWVEDATAPGPDHDSDGRLVFWWASVDEPATRVELTIESEAECRTRVRVVESRPLEVLDVIGIPLPHSGGSAGPAMLVAA